MFDIGTFKSLSKSEKIEFSNPENLVSLSMSLKSKEINSTFSKVILDSTENSYVRINFLKSFSNLCFLEKIPERQVYSLLIDYWTFDKDIFLEIRRLKELLYFYNPFLDVKDDIESVYESCLESSEAEIVGESLYSLGLINFQKALASENYEELRLLLGKSNECFNNSIEEVENRVDAVFLSKIVLILQELFDKKWSSSSHLMTQASNLLFKYDSYSINRIDDNIQYHLYLILKALQNIYNSKPAEWLDIKAELDNIYVNYNEIMNEKVNLKLCSTTSLLSSSLEERVLKPYFITNLDTYLIKIEVLLRDEIAGSDKYRFLCYLKETIEDNPKKKEDALDLKRGLVQAFPNHTDLAESLSENIKTPIDAINACEVLINQEKSLLDSVLYACKKLQGDIVYRRTGINENDRNRDIAKTMEARGFHIKDQPQWATSPTGKDSGEVDIFIVESDGTPKSIIEALNLSYLDKAYLIKHLDKTFSYDVTGLKENFIITYSTATNFEGLWNKYLSFIKSHNYQYQYIEFKEIEHNSTDIRVGCSRHLRHDKEIFLYHILINMYEKTI